MSAGGGSGRYGAAIGRAAKKTPDYALAARRAARRYGINENIFIAQLRQESGLRPGLTSSAGARGIAQFIPSTAKAYGVNLDDGRVSDDLDGAARYMRDNLKRTGGDYRAALSIYNSGRPDGYKRFPETINYVKTIMGAVKGADALGRAATKGRAPGASQQAAQPSTRTEQYTEQTMDREGLEQAQRRATLGRFIANRRPDSVLLKTGVLGTADPDPQQFVKEVTRTREVPVASTSTPAPARASDGRTGGGGAPRGGRPGGGWGGTENLLIPWSKRAHKMGLATTSAKRDSSPAGGAGTASDHHVSQSGASARDWSGSRANMQRLSREIAQFLGVDDYQYGGRDVNVTRGGYRYQLITRPHGTGPHVHLGVRKVGKR